MGKGTGQRAVQKIPRNSRRNRGLKRKEVESDPARLRRGGLTNRNGDRGGRVLDGGGGLEEDVEFFTYVTRFLRMQ